MSKIDFLYGGNCPSGLDPEFSESVQALDSRLRGNDRLAALKRLLSLLPILAIFGFSMGMCAQSPLEVCEKAAEIVAEKSLSCSHEGEQDLKALTQAFKDSSVYGDCHSVKEIRDLDAFVNICFPWYQNAPCYKANDAEKLPPACKNQFIFE